MIHTGTRRSEEGLLPAIVFSLACMFLVLLLLTIKPDVFFSGDGGLKYLVVQQNGKENTTATSLQLDKERWVSNIWNQGFYPFKPPFVYENQGKKIVSFPPYFQALTAPFYNTFGYAGLYIIPAISLVLLWLWLWWLLHRLLARPVVIAGALFCMSFCTPLTLYGAVYWEHTLAVLLFFGGIVFLVKSPNKAVHALALGCLTGLSAWLRPEALLLWLLIAGMVMYNQLHQPNKINAYFVVSSFAIITLFFGCNQILYGNLLGAHSYQLTSDASGTTRFYHSMIQFLHLNAKQLMFYPLTLPIFIIIAYATIKRTPAPRKVHQLLIITIVFSLVAPFFLPNGGGKQWGPRYFLFLVPVVLVAAALFAQSRTLNLTRNWLWLIAPIIFYSLYLNTYKAYTTLHDDYANRVRPCLQFVKQDPCRVVVVQNQFIAQEFAHLFQTKHIFLAENARQYATLQTLLKAAQVTELIFIAHDQEKLLPCNIPQSSSGIPQHLGDYYFVKCSWVP